jgi:hypothetical protein
MEHFERRDVPSGTAYIAAFTLHVDCTGGPDTVTIDHNGSSATVVIDSQTWSFPDNLYYAIAISGGTGGLTTNIRGNVQPLSLLGHHDMDTVKVGDLSNRLQNIQADLDLENPSFCNIVNIQISARGSEDRRAEA